MGADFNPGAVAGAPGLQQNLFTLYADDGELFIYGPGLPQLFSRFNCLYCFINQSRVWFAAVVHGHEDVFGIYFYPDIGKYGHFAIH